MDYLIFLPSSIEITPLEHKHNTQVILPQPPLKSTTFQRLRYTIGMTKVLIGQIAGILAFVQVIPYVISILRGKTRPARMTYFIKSIVAIITISSYIEVGARTSIWNGLAFAFTALLIFGLSIKRGMGGFTRLDMICLALALVGIVLWISTKDAVLTLYLSIFIKTVATLPLFKKAYLHPATENKLSWYIVLVADILNLFALTSLTPAISLLPLFEAGYSAVVVYLLLLHTPKLRKVT